MRAANRRPVPDDLFGGRLTDCFLLDLEVARVVDLSTRLRSLTFLSPDLVGFGWQAGQDVMLTVPGADRPIRRRYTIRRGDPDLGTLDIEVVLHGDGPFARWATGVAVGDRIDGVGPRGVINLRGDAAHHLFVGDESSAPATFAMAEALPAGATATAVLVSEGEPPAPAPGEFELQWLAEEAVEGHLQAVPLPAGTMAYVNGGRSLVRRAATVLAARGLEPAAIATKAYWRRDQPNAAHGEPARD